MSSVFSGTPQGGLRRAPFEVSTFVLFARACGDARFIVPGVVSGYEIGDEKSPTRDMPGSDDNALPGIRCLGLFDTGASRTMISSRLASRLELPVANECRANTAHGAHTLPQHPINLALPNNSMFYGQLAASGDLGDIDFPLGMDVISLGDVAMTRKDDHLVLTFTIYHPRPTLPKAPRNAP